MDDEIKEELLLAIEGAANYLRGMALDPRLVGDTRSACIEKSTELRAIVEKHLDDALQATAQEEP
tara:strand:- start:2764 stop:2958 length:195 start_codon:yes stop_codon:yes gene_type:complete